MFSGINEILLTAVIVLALIFLPRLAASRNAARSQRLARRQPGFSLSGRLRLALLVSFVWIAFWVVYFEPWQKEWKWFVYIGPGPLLVIWGAFWVLQGLKNRSNRV